MKTYRLNRRHALPLALAGLIASTAFGQLPADQSATGGQPEPTNVSGQPLQNPTNGVKPYRSNGTTIRDKNWFRIVESGDYDSGVVYMRFKEEASQAQRNQSHAKAGAVQIEWASRLVNRSPGVIAPFAASHQQ